MTLSAFASHLSCLSEKTFSIDLTGDSPATSCKSAEDDEKKLSLISWNVDGLDTDNLGERARGLCSYLVLYGHN